MKKGHRDNRTTGRLVAAPRAVGHASAAERATRRPSVPRPLRAFPRAFTIVELLIVIGIIILLLSILIVAVNAATRSAQKTNTQALMISLKQGLTSLETDIGYLPPVLDAGRGLLDPPDPDSGSFADDIQNWWSVTTLADYLVGYGHHNQDGYGAIPVSQGGPLHTDESPPTGIRDPGRDGVWGATINGGATGGLVDRMASTTNANIDTGKVYGPYIELAEERVLGSIDGSVDANGELNVFFPGDAGYGDDDPKVICDYWGRPIRFYRRVYAPGALDYPDRRVSLSEVFLLRPFQALEKNVVQDAVTYGGQPIGLTSWELDKGEYAMFSSGADRTLDATVRYDELEFNRDNVVEVGE